MEKFNSSDRSDMIDDQELIEAVLQQKTDPARLNESIGSRFGTTMMQQQSLRSTGTLSRPPSIISKRSMTVSNISNISQSIENGIDTGADGPILDTTTVAHDLVHTHQIKLKITVLALFCVCSLVLSTMAMQIILSLGMRQANNAHAPLITSNSTLVAVTEVAIAVSTFVVVFDVSCLIVCSFQSLVVLQLLQVRCGDERAAKFLHDCSYSRYIAIGCFFVSAPIFLVAVLLYIVLRFTLAATITASIILAIGTLFSVLSITHNSHHWKSAMKGLQEYDCSTSVRTDGLGDDNKLSTLV